MKNNSVLAPMLGCYNVDVPPQIGYSSLKEGVTKVVTPQVKKPCLALLVHTHSRS